MLRNRFNLFAAGVLAAAVCALYLPFLSNPLVFDDRGFFGGSQFAEHASFPFGLSTRFPPFFSIAVIHVLYGTIEAQRLVSLALHFAAACTLFILIRELQRLSASNMRPEPWRAPLVAFLPAALFAVHPITVYGAAYLAQRSIVLATLLGMLSLALFVRGLRRGHYLYAVGAAALFSLSVLCKEHALLLPAVAPAMAYVAIAARRFVWRYTLTYVAACLPAALFVVLLIKGIVGQRYEPDFSDIALQIAPGAGFLEHPWLGSALTQVVLFFRYLALWFFPDTGRMALDLRVDFATTWTPLVAAPAVLGFTAYVAFAIFLVSRRGRAGMAGVGLLWFWVLYLIEFSVVRFQEPFVLYRSYLWAPGIAIALAAALEFIPLRLALSVGVAGIIGLSWQAHDRLNTFSSGLALWEDAAAKLPGQPVPGGARTLYYLGREYIYAEHPDKAVAVIDRCLAEYPEAYHCVFARAAIHMLLEEYEAAIPYIHRAIAARPQGEGLARHHLGFALQQLGCTDQARAQYEIAYKLGFLGAAHRLKSMDAPGEGLLPPSRIVLPSKSFVCPK